MKRKNILFWLISLIIFCPIGIEAQTHKNYVTVAADGSGEYTTPQQAIDAAPTHATQPWIIFIKPGIYQGHVDIPEDKPYLYLIGSGAAQVKITDSRLCGGNGTPRYRPIDGATVVVKASNILLQGITFENAWGVSQKNGPQALALYTCGDRIIVNNCRMLSYQDTYLTTMKSTNRHYIHQCEIEGAVDFIYGCGDVVFDKCKLNIVRKNGGYIVAPCHPSSTRWGYVFLNNTISAPGNPIETNVWLGRPWHESPRTVFIHTLSLVTLPAEGWFDHMGGLPKIWADYKTVNVDGSLQDLSKRRKTYYREDEELGRVYADAVNSLSDEEAAAYTVSNVLSGDDGWNPQQVISQFCGFGAE